MHLTGNEDDGEAANLAYGCRSCNAMLGAAFRAFGAGRPTNQYNPGKGANRYPTFDQYAMAVSNGNRRKWVKGSGWTVGAKDEFGAIIHATPKHLRVKYAKEIARRAGRTKQARFDDRWNPGNVATGRGASPKAKGFAAGRKLKGRGSSAEKLDKLADTWVSQQGLHGSGVAYERDEYRAGLQDAVDEFQRLREKADAFYGRKNPGDYTAGRQAGIDGLPVASALKDHLRVVETQDLNRKLSVDERRIAIQRFRSAYKEGVRARGLGRKNPAAGASEAFEDFHGFKPSRVTIVSKQIHYHEHLAEAGKLKHLDVWGIDDRGHKISGFKGSLLAFNEDRNQLFVEGGDQSLDLKEYGITRPHELETIGKLTDIGYFTNKTHLGDEGGEAVYVHRFRSTNDNGKHVIVRIARYPDLIYDVRNEQLLFSGGSYEILREGIDK
jgi:hypothetical protein